MNTLLHINGKTIALEEVKKSPQEVHFTLKGKNYYFRSQRLEDGTWVLEEELTPGVWRRLGGGAWQSGKNVRTVTVGALEARISETLPGATPSTTISALSPPAPMPGLVRQILVKKGQKVERGQALVVLEAMKLQLTLAAGDDAIVDSVLVTVGQLVSEGAELVKLIAKKN